MVKLWWRTPSNCAYQVPDSSFDKLFGIIKFLLNIIWRNKKYGIFFTIFHNR